MGEIDVCIDNYLNNIRFADVCNGTIFHGKEVIHSDELEDADGIWSYVGNNESVKVTSDKVKKWKGQSIRIICIENQAYIDYQMVVRSMLSKSLGYHRQWKEIKALHRRKKDLAGDEYLSGISREEKLTPIITIIIYFGKTPWDGARTLYQMLGINEKDDIAGMISNYRLNLFDYHDYENFSMFRTDLKNLFEFLKYNEDKNKMREILYNDSSYQTLDEDISILIMKLTNTEIEWNLPINNIERRTGNMCKAFEDAAKEAYDNGVEEGKREMCKTLVSSLKKYIADFEQLYSEIVSNTAFKDYTREQIREYYDI